MKRSTGITTWFLNVSGVLLTNGWAINPEQPRIRLLSMRRINIRKAAIGLVCFRAWGTRDVLDATNQRRRDHSLGGLSPATRPGTVHGVGSQDWHDIQVPGRLAVAGGLMDESRSNRSTQSKRARTGSQPRMGFDGLFAARWRQGHRLRNGGDCSRQNAAICSHTRRVVEHHCKHHDSFLSPQVLTPVSL
jgi:hypothetical protein